MHNVIARLGQFFHARAPYRLERIALDPDVAHAYYDCIFGKEHPAVRRGRYIFHIVALEIVERFFYVRADEHAHAATAPCRNIVDKPRKILAVRGQVEALELKQPLGREKSVRRIERMKAQRAIFARRLGHEIAFRAQRSFARFDKAFASRRMLAVSEHAVIVNRFRFLDDNGHAAKLVESGVRQQRQNGLLAVGVAVFQSLREPVLDGYARRGFALFAEFDERVERRVFIARNKFRRGIRRKLRNIHARGLSNYIERAYSLALVTEKLDARRSAVGSANIHYVAAHSEPRRFVDVPATRVPRANERRRKLGGLVAFPDRKNRSRGQNIRARRHDLHQRFRRGNYNVARAARYFIQRAQALPVAFRTRREQHVVFWHQKLRRRKMQRQFHIRCARGKHVGAYVRKPVEPATKKPRVRFGQPEYGRARAAFDRAERLARFAVKLVYQFAYTKHCLPLRSAYPKPFLPPNRRRTRTQELSTRR